MIQTKTHKPARSAMVLVLGLMLAALLTASLTLATGKPAHAATTFTVTNAFDPGDGTCNTSCTMREAILAANNTPGSDTITFNIPGSGVKTIFPTSALPKITEAVRIEGYSQPGSSLNTAPTGTNAVLNVQLDGSSAGSANGLEILADDVVVQGLAIGGFGFNGIEVDNEGLGNPSGVRIEGNFIGTSASGSAARPNRFNGLNLSDSGGDNRVGGTSRFQRNLISGNGANGVNILANNEGYEVEGNLIGTMKDGASALGNDSDGVEISASSSDNFIGEFSPNAANTIAFNGGIGVDVNGGDANRILSNSIFSNGGLGIDLSGGVENTAGATKNDPQDPDGGPNNLQNKPVLASATTSGGTTTVKGKLDSAPSDPFFVQFFSNPSGNEGKKLIGSKSVSTDSSGNATFTFTPSQTVPAGQNVTATALDVVGGNTSEFSASRSVVAQ